MAKTQHEQVIEALEANGGYATLGKLYQLMDFSSWGTKTPHASVRRIVQDRKEIFKIRPGLWALEAYRNQLPPQILATDETPDGEKEIYTHAYFQGLLLEIGNMRKFITYVPAQDKNQLFLEKRLGDVAQSTTCPEFTYEHVLRRTKTIDVIWFNQRQFPATVYEVEHSTDFQNSLLKFVELQDFNVQFCIVADEVRRRSFESKFAQSAFEPIRDRVEFRDYEYISNWHQKQYELSQLGT